MSSYKFEEVCNFCYKLSSHKASPTYTFRNKASGGGSLVKSCCFPPGKLLWVHVNLVCQIERRGCARCDTSDVPLVLGILSSLPIIVSIMSVAIKLRGGEGDLLICKYLASLCAVPQCSRRSSWRINGVFANMSHTHSCVFALTTCGAAFGCM